MIYLINTCAAFSALFYGFYPTTHYTLTSNSDVWFYKKKRSFKKILYDVTDSYRNMYEININ